MGWTSSRSWSKKSDVAQAVLRDCYRETPPLETKSTRSGLWVLAQGDDSPRIDYYLISGDGGSWGYKDLSECMGPADVDVPLAWLDRAPERDGAWRARVRAEAEARRVVFAPGESVVVHGRPYTMVGLQGRSWVVADAEGRSFRVPTHVTVRRHSDVLRERAAREAELEASPFRVITAWGSWHERVPAGQVGLRLTRGGNFEGYGPKVHILVPEPSYNPGSYDYTGEEQPWCGPDGAVAGCM